MTEALDRIANLRDVAHSSSSLRPGVLWRSAQPLAGDGTPDEMSSWPPATVVDLRSSAEIPGGAHPLLGPATTVHQVPLLDIAADPRNLPARLPTLVEVYLSMLEPGTALLRAAVLVADAAAPVLVHCAAGKDRTGLLIALVLRLVGVDRDSVLADFALTTDNMPAVMRRLLATSPLPPGADLSALPAEYFTAPVQALAEILDVWDRFPGGVSQWASAHGAPPDLENRLRRKLMLD